MLKGTLIHPQILNALGRAGHGSQILIADSNFPFSTTLGRNSELVSLNLTPGVVSCTQVLESLASSIPIEAGAVILSLPRGIESTAPISALSRSISSRIAAARGR